MFEVCIKCLCWIFCSAPASNATTVIGTEPQKPGAPRAASLETITEQPIAQKCDNSNAVAQVNEEYELECAKLNENWKPSCSNTMNEPPDDDDSKCGVWQMGICVAACGCGVNDNINLCVNHSGKLAKADPTKMNTVKCVCAHCILTAKPLIYLLMGGSIVAFCPLCFLCDGINNCGSCCEE